jgi:hypothetical protein
VAIDVSQSLESDQKTDSAQQEITGAQSPLSLLNDQISKNISCFKNGSKKLFNMVEYYESCPVNTLRALRNHGLQNHGVERIYAFVNTSHFRAKNGLLLCNDVLSIKDFWEKPIHFDLYSPSDGILKLKARLEKGGTLNLTVSRVTVTEGHQRSKGITPRTIKMANLDGEIFNPPNKYLIEVMLPALVRNLALVCKSIHEALPPDSGSQAFTSKPSEEHASITSTDGQSLGRAWSSDLDASMVITITSRQAIDGHTRRIEVETGESVERLDVKIPPNTSDGMRLRLNGKGKLDHATRVRGDLYLIILVKK